MEKIFTNGIFYDGKYNNSISYLKVKDGKIMDMGKDFNKIEKSKFDIVDLQGSFILPGFIDCHMHLLTYSQKKLYEIDLSNINSKEGMIDTIRKFINKKNIQPGKWIIGAGWNQDKFQNNSFPDRYLLDEIAPNNPVFLTRACYHICVLNSRALEIAKIDKSTPSPTGGRIDKFENGIPTGILRENAMDLVVNILPRVKEKKDIKELILKGCNDLLDVGITTVHTDDFSFVEDKRNLWETFKEMAQKNQLPLRIVLQLRASKIEDVIFYKKLGLKTGMRINNLLIGPVKIISDGSLGSRTAALESDYSDDYGNRGLMIIEDEELDKIVFTSFKNDFDICVHGIGDRAISKILNVYEKYYDIYKSKNFRPSIIHCQIASEDILNKFKKLGVIANIQPIFQITDWKIAESRVGKERIKYSYCWKKYFDRGIICVGSSDAPIESFNPIYGIYAAVTRKDLFGLPNEGWFFRERLSVKNSIDIFTKNPTILSGEENIKGSFEIGKYADFIVLTEDLTKIDEEDIKNILVKKTLIGGK